MHGHHRNLAVAPGDATVITAIPSTQTPCQLTQTYLMALTDPWCRTPGSSRNVLTRHLTSATKPLESRGQVPNDVWPCTYCTVLYLSPVAWDGRCYRALVDRVPCDLRRAVLPLHPRLVASFPGTRPGRAHAALLYRPVETIPSAVQLLIDSASRGSFWLAMSMGIHPDPTGPTPYPGHLDAQRPVSPANVAATDIHHFRDAFAHDRSPALTCHYEPITGSETGNSWLSLASNLPRPCIGPRKQIGDSAIYHLGYMSDRSHEQRQSQSTQERHEQSGSNPNRPSENDQDSRRSVSSAAMLPAQQRRQTGHGHSFELPPIPPVSGASSANVSSSGSRLASVSSLLNLPEEDEQHGRRRKIIELESPVSSGSTSRLPPPYRRSSPQSMSSTLADRQPRRILTPISPSLHRAVSLSALSQPAQAGQGTQSAQGTIDAYHSPFLVSPRTRTVTVEPGVSGVPPLPSLPASMRSTPGQLGLVASSESTQRTNSVMTYDSEQASASMSPESSYLRHNQVERPSPDAQHPSEPAYSAASASSMGTSPTGQDRARPASIPISSSGGQNVYQMMTLETTSGTVQLPVDVQAASRVADEKRRRNAGASARFRQRRKEKEKEASTTISRLEQQLKDAAEDLEFYRRERDHLANALLQTPSGDRHFPRPQSPRRRRPSISYVGSAGSIGSAYEMDDEPASPDEARNVRRRTSIMSVPLPPHSGSQSAPTGSGSYQTGYPPSYSGVPVLQQHPHPQAPGPAKFPPRSPRGPMHDLVPRTGSLPGSQQHYPFPPPQQPPGAHGISRVPQLMHAPPQTGPWNPYATDRGPRGPPPGPNPESRHFTWIPAQRVAPPLKLSGVELRHFGRVTASSNPAAEPSRSEDKVSLSVDQGRTEKHS
nr:hypothetical protein CFP56_09299 [Quercus suber]